MLLLAPDPQLTNPVKLSDWLELQAIVSPDGNSSAGDLQSVLRSYGNFRTNENEDEQIEQLVSDTFVELRQRGISAGLAYPFDLPTPSLLQLRDDRQHYSAYIFCLILSWSGETGSGNGSPSMLFEQVSCVAAERYIDGEALRFGWPRTEELPSDFPDAVRTLLDRIGEGGKYRDRPTMSGSKDRKLDIVAWKHFPDNWKSKILLFGQCASGRLIQEKLNELNPETFCNLWFTESLSSPLINAAFIPHRLQGRDHWNDVVDSMNRALLFDRCRVAFWAHDNLDFAQHTDWIDRMIKSAT